METHGGGFEAPKLRSLESLRASDESLLSRRPVPLATVSEFDGGLLIRLKLILLPL